MQICPEPKKASAAQLYLFGPFRHPEGVRFNFDLDTLFVHVHQQDEALQQSELTRLRYLIIECAIVAQTLKFRERDGFGGSRYPCVYKSDGLLGKSLNFYDGQKLEGSGATLFGHFEGLPPDQEDYKDAANMRVAYGWQPSTKRKVANSAFHSRKGFPFS